MKASFRAPGLIRLRIALLTVFTCVWFLSPSADCADDAESTDPGCAAGEAWWSEWLTVGLHGEVRHGLFFSDNFIFDYIYAACPLSRILCNICKDSTAAKTHSVAVGSWIAADIKHCCIDQNHRIFHHYIPICNFCIKNKYREMIDLCFNQ